LEVSDVTRLSLHNGSAVEIGEIPELGIEAWRNSILNAVGDGARVTALFAAPSADGADRSKCLVGVLADDAESCLYV